MFKSLRERLAGWKEKAEAEVTSEAIGGSGRKIKEDKLEEILYDLEIALLESDVAFPVAKEIVDRLADDLRGKRISKEVSLEQGVEAALRDAITEALSVPPLDFFGLIEKSPRPFVVMFVGVNGTGKTTTITKPSASMGSSSRRSTRTPKAARPSRWRRRSGSPSCS